MTYFSIDLDELGEDIFHELERVQDGKGSHKAVFNGPTRTDAADRLLIAIKPFITEKMIMSDEEGYEI